MGAFESFKPNQKQKLKNSKKSKKVNSVNLLLIAHFKFVLKFQVLFVGQEP